MKVDIVARDFSFFIASVLIMQLSINVTSRKLKIAHLELTNVHIWSCSVNMALVSTVISLLQLVLTQLF